MAEYGNGPMNRLRREMTAMRRRSGVVLLELLCALLVVSLVGIAVVAQLEQHIRSFSKSVLVERELKGADRLLSRLAVTTVGELEPMRALAMRDGYIIERVELPGSQQLLRVRPLSAPQRILLSTIVYTGNLK